MTAKTAQGTPPRDALRSDEKATRAARSTTRDVPVSVREKPLLSLAFGSATPPHTEAAVASTTDESAGSVAFARRALQSPDRPPPPFANEALHERTATKAAVALRLTPSRAERMVDADATRIASSHAGHRLGVIAIGAVSKPRLPPLKESKTWHDIDAGPPAVRKAAPTEAETGRSTGAVDDVSHALPALATTSVMYGDCTASLHNSGCATPPSAVQRSDTPRPGQRLIHTATRVAAVESEIGIGFAAGKRGALKSGGIAPALAAISRREKGWRDTLGVGVCVWLGVTDGVGNCVEVVVGDPVRACDCDAPRLSVWVRLGEGVGGRVGEGVSVGLGEALCDKVGVGLGGSAPLRVPSDEAVVVELPVRLCVADGVCEELGESDNEAVSAPVGVEDSLDVKVGVPDDVGVDMPLRLGVDVYVSLGVGVRVSVPGTLRDGVLETDAAGEGLCVNDADPARLGVDDEVCVGDWLLERV